MEPEPAQGGGQADDAQGRESAKGASFSLSCVVLLWATPNGKAVAFNAVSAGLWGALEGKGAVKGRLQTWLQKRLLSVGKTGWGPTSGGYKPPGGPLEAGAVGRADRDALPKCKRFRLDHETFVALRAPRAPRARGF